MKIIACIMTDFDTGPLGLPSRLGEELRGVPVLRRTVQRLLACERLAGIHVLVRPGDHERAAALLAGLDVRIETHNADPAPWRELVASARKWSLNAWRGGIAGMTVFDETLHPWVLEALARQEQADAVVDVAPSAALIDPGLVDAVAQHYLDLHEETRLAFTQAPPGLSVMIYSVDLLAQLARANQPIGRIMAYHPAEPQRDMVHQKCFYSCGSGIMYAQGRCLADTSTALERMGALLDAHGGEAPPAEDIARWLARPTDGQDRQALPEEVEIELTTETCLPRSTLRPWGGAAGRRGPMEITCFQRLVDELVRRDDLRLVLGGFGEPLLHPAWEELLREAREAGVFGVAVRTSGLTLDDASAMTLSASGVDIVNVLIDAHSAATYLQVHGEDRYDELMARIESVNRAHQATQQPHPLLVPEMTKSPATMDELESFYDAWIQRTGTAVVRGPSHYAGQWPDLNVMQMAPPGRSACQRIYTRAMVLADGRVTFCDQDFRGAHAAGSLHETSLSDVWTGPAMEALRRAHENGDFGAMALCPACDEWHRP